MSAGPGRSTIRTVTALSAMTDAGLNDGAQPY